MNPIMIFLLLMSCLGFIDKFLGNKWGLMKPFNEGMALIGELLVYIVGVYCVGLSLATTFAGHIAGATEGWFFDPSVISGSILASDLGGYPVSTTIAQNPLIGRFSGVVIAGTLGILISFYLPVYLADLKGEDADKLTLGFLFGIVVLPVTMIVGGLFLEISPGALIKNLIPVIIFCGLLLLGLLKAKKATITALGVFGKVFRVFTFGSFFIVVLGLFFPKLSLIDRTLSLDAVVMVARMGVTIAGSLVTVEICRRVFKKQLDALSAKLRINDWSLLGMLVALPAGIANVETTQSLLVFLFVKLAGGILAVTLASFYLRDK
ncbi:MAG: ethanolamine utilization protein EutH [Clostridiales bacterium]|nr:ethanolamine utilization protein EutH [Clostridiales bacterium]